MEDSVEFEASVKKMKRSRWGPVTENDSPIKKSTEGPGKIIPNGTGNRSSENLEEEEIVKVKSKGSIKISKVTKSPKTEQPANIKSQKGEPSSVKTRTPCDSPTTSQFSNDEFHGFESIVLSEKQSEKQDALFRILENLNTGVSPKDSEEDLGPKSGTIKESDVEVENKCEEDMTVDTGHESDSDSYQMEIDMGNDKDNAKADSAESSDKHDSRTKDLEIVDIMETDSVKSASNKISRRSLKSDINKDSGTDGKVAESPILESTLKGSGTKVEYCGVCESVVDDAEDGICCDECQRWFHLRCSGLTQVEYNELGRDENAKWACNKCSGKPTTTVQPTTPAAQSKPLLSVRKDLGKISMPSATKRRSVNKEGTPRTPKIDISNPAFLKPFDFGWKRELVYRTVNDSHNRRQGDVYYYTPKGKKLRSLREINDYLVGSDLTQDNFTFWKEPIGIEDPLKEIIRDAKLKIANKDASSPSPSVPKKTTPKIAKTPRTTPKLTATVTPLESSNSTATVTTTATPKASASVTPRVVLKGKTGVSTGPKFKITPSKNSSPGQTQKIVISKVYTDY